MKQPILVGIISAWAVVISLSVVVLGWLFFQSRFGHATLIQAPQTEVDQTAESNSNVVGLISQVASLSEKVAALESQVASASQTFKPIASTQSDTQLTSPSREYYVPLGSGSTTNRDWTAITGAAVNFNPNKYQPIKRVHFEAAGSIISGEVHVVLADLTHNRVYYEGELIFNSSSATWKRSQPLMVASTPGQLQVQIQSTNGEMAILNDSRLVVESGN